MYTIFYDYEDQYNIQENFEGSWIELQNYIANMRKSGCYNIYAAAMGEDDD